MNPHTASNEELANLHDIFAEAVDKVEMSDEIRRMHRLTAQRLRLLDKTDAALEAYLRWADEQCGEVLMPAIEALHERNVARKEAGL